MQCRTMNNRLHAYKESPPAGLNPPALQDEIHTISRNSIASGDHLRDSVIPVPGRVFATPRVVPPVGECICISSASPLVGKERTTIAGPAILVRVTGQDTPAPRPRT